jgi:hypothetical protein
MAMRKPVDQCFTSENYTKIGEWISGQLRSHGVWLVLMPAGQFSGAFTRGLEHNPQWPLVFINNKQKIFVDAATPQGEELVKGIFTGKTLYPDEFHKNLILGHHYAFYPDATVRKQAPALLAKALNDNPSPAPMLQMITRAARSPDLAPDIEKFCASWVDEFEKNTEKYAARDGYRLRLEAARLACVHLENLARSRKNTQLADAYRKKRTDYRGQRGSMSLTKRW